MAGLLESLSVRWTVTIPKRAPWPYSQTFQLGDEPFCLNCCQTRRKIIFLNLMCRNDTPFESCLIGLYCTVSVESTDTGKLLSTQSIRMDDRGPEWMHQLDSYIINIWQLHVNEIEEFDFNFDFNRELTFTMTWGTTPLHISPYLTQVRTFEYHALRNPSPESSSMSSSKKKSTNDVSVQTSSCCTNQSLDSVLDDFAKLLDGDSNTDVELHCEGHITKAHRAILSVRSPVLETMLQTDMVEGRTGVVMIKDMDSDTFHSFVRYLYTGKLQLDALTFDAAMRLYEAGDMYRVESLARRCSPYLIDNLTVENSYHALVVADAHSDSSFVDEIIAYMVREKIPMSGDNWKAFCDTHSKLANQVLSNMCEKLSN